MGQIRQELINVDELIFTALNDQKAVGTGIKAFHGINFADLNVAYHRFCKNENVGDLVVDLRQVIEFFNDAAADLPDHARLKGRKLPSMTAILDGKGANFADVFEPKRHRAPSSAISLAVASLTCIVRVVSLSLPSAPATCETWRRHRTAFWRGSAWSMRSSSSGSRSTLIRRRA